VAGNERQSEQMTTSEKLDQKVRGMFLQKTRTDRKAPVYFGYFCFCLVPP